MIIPIYWDEHKEKRKTAEKRQVTISRFGWSENTQNEALELAKKRVDEAFTQLSAGHDVERRELRVSYNGSDGVPIREEIIQYHDDAVVTRNIYGALCLNTPDVVFADVDFGDNYHYRSNKIWAWILIVIGYSVYIFAPDFFYDLSQNMFSYDLYYLFLNNFYDIHIGTVIGSIGIILWAYLTLKDRWTNVDDAKFIQNAYDQKLTLIKQFSDNHPEWNLRIYRTPAGFRVMAMHQTYSSDDPEIIEFFTKIDCDRQYAVMCKRQGCFRARVSPKPWRVGLIGEEAKMSPRGKAGVWPVSKNTVDQRNAWISKYDDFSNGYASCRFEVQLGAEKLNEKCEKIRRIHDQYCKADGGLPLA
jgi:hypothetical protein